MPAKQKKPKVYVKTGVTVRRNRKHTTPKPEPELATDRVYNVYKGFRTDWDESPINLPTNHPK